MNALTTVTRTTTRTLNPSTALRTLHATRRTTKPIAPAPIKPAFEPLSDAGNYLTGGGSTSSMSIGDMILLLSAGSAVVWVAGKVSEEVKDVVWPEVKWLAKRVKESAEGEEK